MYYDRRLPETLLRLLTPDEGALGHLVTALRTPWGAENLAHLQFRRAEGARSLGGVQLYLGRTSPLEVVAKPKATFALTADKTYKAVTPELFERRYTEEELKGVAELMQAHLRACAEGANRSFLDGEAVVHAGLMRRYGMAFAIGDPLLAVDSEVRVGFDSIDSREEFEEALRKRLEPGEAGVPRKLDTIGVLPGGDIGLVEIKELGGDMVRAVVQAAAHVATMSALRQRADRDLSAVLNGLIEQKAQVGLLDESSVPQVSAGARLVPVVAAPVEDGDARWFDDWCAATAEVRAAQSDLLEGLQFWRLSAKGALLEARVV